MPEAKASVTGKSIMTKLMLTLPSKKQYFIDVIESVDTFTIVYDPRTLTPEDQAAIDNIYQKMYNEWDRSRKASGAM